MALEAVRAWHFPHKPSRLKSTFACDNLETMKCYHSKNNPDGFIYEVSIEDNTAPVHKGDFNAIEPLSSVSYNMWQIANLYWEYGLKTSVETWENIECSEIVLASPLRVIRKVTR